MPKYVDISQYVSATYYDEENQEWSQKTVTIEDVLCSVCDDYEVSEIPVKYIPIATIQFDEDKMREIIDNAIIRCKDCKYMTEHYDTDGNAPYWTCSEWDSGTDYDGFCHYAERRTDEIH